MTTQQSGTTNQDMFVAYPDMDVFAKNILRPPDSVAITKELEILGQFMVAGLQVFTPVATGRLRQSTHAVVIPPETAGIKVGVWTLEIRQSARGLLGFPVFYGAVIARGTSPFIPPVIPLEFWVRLKFGLGTAEAIKVAKSIVFGGIGRKGIEENNFPRLALAFSRHEIQETANRIGRVLVARLASVPRARVIIP